MTSLLEERYRRALRLLPADYRRLWEEDMVSSFLEAAYASTPDDPEGVEISSPSHGEVASIALLALRLRLGGTGAPPRAFAWGEAIRRVALICLLVPAVESLLMPLFMTWHLAHLPRPGVVEEAQVGFASQWWALWAMAGLLWIPTYLSAVFGHYRAARIMAVVAFIPAAITSVVQMLDPWNGPVPAQAYWLFLAAVPMLALTAFGPNVPRVRARPWLVALPVGAAVSFAVALLTAPLFLDNMALSPLVDVPGMYCAALICAAMVHLASRDNPSPSWPLALALLVPLLLGLRVTTLLGHFGETVVPMTIGAVQCLLLAATGTALAAVAVRRLRRLPTATETLRAPASEHSADGR
ncbi:hypothetical protein AB0M36_35260 [Actinoplanes sp. NPDC051346]|uniref:hypothetical protein n=1 Tax=Actinoplanes sp. NPDC051346 TaxID=3155048 RepID=UPI0034153BC7